MKTTHSLFQNIQQGLAVVAIFAMILLSSQGLFAPSAEALAGPGADIDQAQNGGVGKTVIDPIDWVNGNVNKQKGHYVEGQSIPYRMEMTGLTPGEPSTLIIGFDVKVNGKFAIDYITSNDRIEEGVSPCLGISGCTGLPDTMPIPAPTYINSEGVITAADVTASFNALVAAEGVQEVELWNGTLNSVLYTKHADLSLANDDAQVTIIFTPTAETAVFSWGGRISTSIDYPGLSAVNINGSPYHSRLVDLDGKGGSQDKQLSAFAVSLPGNVTVTKAVVNDNGGVLDVPDFPLFVGSTPVISGVAGDFDAGSYVVSETEGLGYSASVWGGDCAEDGSLVVEEGQVYSCSITNNDIAPSLTLTKEVVGGDAVVADFKLTANGPVIISGNGSVTSDNSFLAGTYSLSEIDNSNISGNAGAYTQGSWNCTNDVTVNSSSEITLALGESTECTVVNTYVPADSASLHVKKVLVQDNGGSADYSDFGFAINGVEYSWDAGVDTQTFVIPESDLGYFTVVETDVAGRYDVSYENDQNNNLDCSDLDLNTDGDEATCVITNDDISSELTVIKHVVDTSMPGDKDADDFTMIVSGAGVSLATFPGSEVGTTVTLNAGDYEIGEQNTFGYNMQSSVDCSGTINLGESKTCTITNTEPDPTVAYVTFTKVVNNDFAGTSTPEEFSFNVGGDEVVTSIQSGETIQLGVGEYGSAEFGPDGYENDSITGVCAGDGSFSVEQSDLGLSFECVYTNSDIQPKLTVIKLVVNDNKYERGTATSSDFTMNVDGTNVSDTGFGGDADGVLITLDAGTYEVTEDSYPGYVQIGYSDECKGVIGVGEEKTCTITNDDISEKEAFITVTKILNQDFGGTATTSDFAFMLNAGDSVDFESDGSNEIIVTSAGTYSIDEVFVPGYSTSYFGCSPDVELGAAYECVITNTQLPQCSDGIDNDDDGIIDFKGGDPGCDDDDDNDEEDPETSITIDKIVNGENADTDQAFGFDFSWIDGALDTSISANDDPYKIVVEPGSGLVVTESLEGLSRWGIESISCTSEDGSVVENDLDDVDNSVTLNLSVGEVISCVFTNYYTPRDSGGNDENIIVMKEVTDGSDIDMQFGFDVSWFDADGEFDFLLKDGGKFDSGDLSADEHYSVYESLPDYWNQESVECSSSESIEKQINPDDILLSDGETVTCVFTNNQEMFEIYGYIWDDANSNGVWDGFDIFMGNEGQVEGEHEAPLNGWSVSASNGLDIRTTTTNSEGYYSFTVPAGVWSLSETLQSSWLQTFPGSVTYVVTVPSLSLTSVNEDENMFAQALNYIIPTAHASYGYQTIYGAYNFGNVYSGGGGGGGGSKTARCDLFEASSYTFISGDEITLNWETTRGYDLTLSGPDGEIFSTTDDDIVDEGSVLISPVEGEYELEVNRGTRKDTCSLDLLKQDAPTPTVLGVSTGPQIVPPMVLGVNTGAGGASTDSVLPTAITFICAVFALGAIRLTKINV